jgi:very-short-patch-repair endonuclease
MFALKFKRQHPIGGLIVDFYCAELRLALEIDGGSHAGPGRGAYDAARTALLETRGVRVVRARNEDVSARTLRELLRDLAERPPSPRRGEGDRG